MTILLATTGGGKSLVKCHAAASALMYGKNVLYITMEMAEERIAQRIDANLLDVSLDDIISMSKETYERKISRLRDKTPGKLVIKEYPTGSAHAGHFRYMINELKMKKNFSPDLICIDYLNICSSSRVKGASANSYSIIKSVAEEIRGLAMEFDCAVLTSSQYNRSGYDTSDVELTSTSESMGTAHTADAIFALISSEELESMGHLMIKQLKNRWGDLSYYRRFVVGIDRSKMKLYNLEEKVQKSIQSEESSDKPTFDKSSFGEGFSKKGKKKFDMEDIQ
jgi:predicted ATP-dependent serine protease